MGANPVSSEQKQYFNIFGSVFTTKSNPETPNAIKRTTAPKKGEPKDVWELHYESLNGMIKSLTVKETEYGKKYEIILDDIGEQMILQIPVESNYGDALMNRLPNIDLNTYVTLKPYSFIPKGESKKKEGITVTQNKIKIESAYTKELPKDKPQPQHEKMDGDDWKIYNITVRKFFAKKLAEIMGNATVPVTIDRVYPKTEEEAFTVDSDDLPF